MSDKEQEMRVEISQWCRLRSDPVFIGDYFLADGHSEQTINATATFVKFGGRYYACTCHHVQEIVDKQKVEGEHGRVTLQIMAGKSVLNLSAFRADGLQTVLNRPEEDGYPIDLCIANISSHWQLLQREKGKKAIDLDGWHEPPWEKIEMGAAAGYATHGKRRAGKFVETDMPLVIAESHSQLGPQTREFTMRSTLDEPHGIYFSGMSGGPIVGCWDDKYLPIGFVFEGEPSSPRKEASIYTGPNDIFIRGLLLTRDRFAGWLDSIGK